MMDSQINNNGLKRCSCGEGKVYVQTQGWRIGGEYVGKDARVYIIVCPFCGRYVSQKTLGDGETNIRARWNNGHTDGYKEVRKKRTEHLL